MSSQTNPFEDGDAAYLVLSNEENQHSLWPAGIEVPAGWTVVNPSDTREASLAYIEENWQDMRPRSLVNVMQDAA
ncbi:MbtH family protein [Plantactinospora endophytica]|uniref:Protein mbtH n=1 Tax=Plantactinospora endophytica TaxID=673535 RepID=A0ABQ4EC24_9ACTN|nr:MbtH family protein [Plantactinospora endophytica]GIG92287.1 protein mbtH [Plantactinospora endophytica]